MMDKKPKALWVAEKTHSEFKAAVSGEGRKIGAEAERIIAWATVLLIAGEDPAKVLEQAVFAKEAEA
jgi:hypothetical protein